MCRAYRHSSSKRHSASFNWSPSLNEKEFLKIFSTRFVYHQRTHWQTHFDPPHRDDGTPAFSRQRRLAPDRLRIAEQESEHMLELGYGRPSSSSWSSALHREPKRNGDWRPCGYYRALDPVSDSYQIPNVQDFTGALQVAAIFSKADLMKA